MGAAAHGLDEAEMAGIVKKGAYSALIDTSPDEDAERRDNHDGAFEEERLAEVL